MSGAEKKHAGGRPPYEPNDKDRRIVESMARFLGHDQIAVVLGISDETMRKYYRYELDTAKIKTDAAVGKSLILQAVGGPKQEWDKAVVAATIFYAKTRIPGFSVEQIPYDQMVVNQIPPEPDRPRLAYFDPEDAKL
jgi:hypothetical protein